MAAALSGVAACDYGCKAAIERKMQQHRGQHAQDREAEEHDDFRQPAFRVDAIRAASAPML